ncbi:hypothetical protein SPW_4212 [Streptomyces sp. W007]|nr:hypothetical protein SPW_4212 [Streptomyces sp. W007]
MKSTRSRCRAPEFPTGPHARTERKAQWSFRMLAHSTVTEFTGGREDRRSLSRATGIWNELFRLSVLVGGVIDRTKIGRYRHMLLLRLRTALTSANVHRLFGFPFEGASATGSRGRVFF